MSLQALVIISNPIAGKQLARVLKAGGFDADIVSDPSHIAATVAAKAFHLICAPIQQAELLQLPEASRSRILYWSDDRALNGLELASRDERILGIFGLRHPGGLPRSWELLALTRRLQSQKPTPPEAHLMWGATHFTAHPKTSKERDQLVNTVETFAKEYLTANMANAIAEIAHELIMNAMYDAPVGHDGTPLYAHHRSAEITLTPTQQPTITYGCDGTKLLLAASDPFGRLPRSAVFGGILRGTSQGGMDQSGGGAGLGFSMIYKAAPLLFCDVVPRKQTLVTAILELDIPQRDLRSLPRSLHFIVHSHA